MDIYQTPGAFRGKMAGKGTEQAKTRPLTLQGIADGTVKYSPTDSEFAAWQAESDQVKRDAILDAMKHRTLKTGKVQVTTEALASWVARCATLAAERSAAALAAHEAAPLAKGETRPEFVPILGRDLFRADIAGGFVVLDTIAEDDTEAVIDELFPED